MTSRPHVPTSTRRWAAAAIPLLLGLTAACGSSSTPAAPSALTTAALADGQSDPLAARTPAVAPTATPMTPALQDALAATLQDEYHAKAVYDGVIGDLGAVRPFVNIVKAEQVHADAVARLFTAHGVVPPASAWSPANVPHFSTLVAACAAAADAERANIALYDRYLATDLPLDVRTVFTNLRAASEAGHLPAFTRCD